MKKFILCLLITSFFNAIYSKEIKVGYLNGPSCIPCVYLMDNTKQIKNEKVSYQKFADPQALLPKMLKNEIDIGFLPVNVAAKVYNSSNGAIQVFAIVGLGNLSLVTTDQKITSIDDLKGKKVYVAGQGATPDYIFKYILDQHKISYSIDDNPNGVTLDFSIAPANLPAMLSSGKIDCAVLPEPFVTVSKNKCKNVKTIDLQKQEYLNYNKEIYPLTVMVCTKEFAKNNSNLLETFKTEYKKASEWTISNPSKAGALSEKYELGLPASVVEKSIPYSNYVYINGKDLQNYIEKILNLFLIQEPASIGGKLPDEKFYI